MTASPASLSKSDEQTQYRRRVWAWTMYDWANSAYATTILAAVLPVYFSKVAGATLPSAAVATSYWSFGLSISLLIVAVLAPILGTLSDVIRGKKRLLTTFAGIGILGTGALVAIDTGDWMLALILGIISRIGFTGANSFYDALLPHVAKPDDQDRVSSRGYAMGYLGGGLLLAINVVMIQFLPGTWGPRISFLSVAVWWAVFSIPILRLVPEPEAAGEKLTLGLKVISASFKRLRDTLADIRQYRELFKYLLSFLIYNDGIGTIIGVAAIYGAELGLGSVELVLVLLLVQFVAMPYSLIFGRLPKQGDKRRPFFLAFVLINLVALPLVGLVGAGALPINLTGAKPAHFDAQGAFLGEGKYAIDNPSITYIGSWQPVTVSAKKFDAKQDALYQTAAAAGSGYEITFNGEQVQITYSVGPDHGIWSVTMDGEPVTVKNKPLTLDAYNRAARYEETKIIQAKTAGQHTLRLVSTDQANAKSSGHVISLAGLQVLPGVRVSNLGVILGIIALIEGTALGLAWLIAPSLRRLAETFDTKRSILLALGIYTVIAVWGFILNSGIEFWFLAWMVAIVQGGSQALSRSLYASMSPASKSGEFFGLFGVMEKFSAIIGPLLFGLAGALFGSSRPAVLSLIALFAIGGYLLTRVNVAEGRRVAQTEDAALR